jgi:lipopolysaccharide/colanic/teichoic acid biosynthesis glycosyltransferase
MSVKRTKQAFLLGGDALLFFSALYIALSIRAGAAVRMEVYEQHIPYFIIICSIYVLMQYIFGMYDTGVRRTHTLQLRKIIVAAIYTVILSTLYFYLLQSATISPKTILLLTITLASIGSYMFRTIFSTVIRHQQFTETIGIIGDKNHPDIIEFVIQLNPHSDLSLAWITTTPSLTELQSVHTIVFHRDLFGSDAIKADLYTHIVGKKQILTFTEVYESICKKIPAGSLNTDWFITNVPAHSVVYERIKAVVDFFFGIMLFIALIVSILPISILIATTSKGPIFIKQTRIGKSGKHFILYKFRTMFALAADGSAETHGAVFSTKGDSRITPVGKWLRKTRLDELPQAINLLRRDVSIIGPRPERPEIVDSLIAEAPYFSTRTLVMPGITGWAAVHQHYTDTKTSTIEKLQYDLYYIKYRSIWIDMKILLLTIRAIIDMKGQ